MVFANLIFLYLFLPINFIFYFVTHKQVFRNLVLVLFSLFFYAWGEPVWILLLVFSATADYIHGLLVEAFRGTIGAKIAVASSLVLNIGLLGLFKYSGFLVENFNTVFSWQVPVPKFVLPIGISFYTFQTISYVVDVYRGRVKAQRNYMNFLLFVSLYHRLVAGPIVRYSEVEHELGRECPTFASMSGGISRFCVGLVKKVLVANYAGQLVGQYLVGDIASLSVAEGWFGIVLFALQLYYDFSGYSDMALGLGLMFGCHYNENFCYPYISKTAGEFWRRWHISLGSFFRDYVYIPLGGGHRRVYRNLFVVWLLTGLWHGASWNYILWGLYYGLLLALERLFLRRFLEKLPVFFSHAYLIFATLLGWTLFYFEDMGRLRTMLSVLLGFSGNPVWDPSLGFVLMNQIFWLILAIVFCAPVLPMLKNRLAHASSRTRIALAYVQPVFTLAMLAVCTAMLVGESYNPFLYFKF